MTKEIAQTVGGKRIAWLLALLAAFAVFATLSTWQGAKANVTGGDFVVTNDDPAPVDGNIIVGQSVTYTVTFTVGASPHVSPSTVISGALDADLDITSFSNGGPAPTCTGDVGTGNTFSCTYTPALAAAATGTLTITAQLKGSAADGVALAAAAVLVNDGSGQAAQAADVTGLTALTQQNAALSIAKVGPAGPVAAGGAITYTITVSNAAAAETATNVVVTDTLDSQFNTVVAITPSEGTCTPTPLPSTTLAVSCTGIALAATESATITITALLDNPLAAGANVTNQASFTSTVNAVAGPTGSSNIVSTSLTQPALPTLPDGLYHVDAFGNLLVGTRDDENNLIGFTHKVCLVDTGDTFGVIDGIIPPAAADGSAASVFWRIDTLSGTPNVNGQSLTTGVFGGTYSNGGTAQAPLECVSWYSTNPGEQNVTMVNGNGVVIADWADGGDDAIAAGVGSATPLVKEWNTLLPTAILSGSTNVTDTTITSGAVFDASDGVFIGTPVSLTENVYGEHESVGGHVGPILVDGAEVKFAVSGTCGQITIEADDTADADADTTITVGQTATKTSAGVAMRFTVNTNNCTSLTGSSTVVTITVGYSNLIGSLQPGGDVETITVNWVAVNQTKQVFLAWAGQRVIIEHDWNVAGTCVFGPGVFDVEYKKGSGPGNFLPALGAVTAFGSDVAHVEVDSSQARSSVLPQSGCISSALYESEDQGQVDIEAFVQGSGASKVAFVVYYMKLESVAVSLVDDVSKPTHNSTGTDFAPGNPWDAAADVTSVDWNVSKDLLVRARVKGWFTTSNPTGRAAGTDANGGGLPAGRWVMPDDWEMLAGGALAEQYRPEFDIMVAPDSGLLCDTPIGGCTETLIPVTNLQDYGDVPAPVEGPFSLLDLYGDAGSTLSNIPPYTFRETTVRDGDVDLWDAPMPPALLTVDIRGAGFIKQVLKQDVYWTGTVNDATKQDYTNPFYSSNIPDSPFITANAAGGGYVWNSWGNDGPGGNGQGAYNFWQPALVGVNIFNNPGEALSAAQQAELAQIRAAYKDNTIARRLVVYTDNHGEAMVAANGDFNLDYSGCTNNLLGGGKHCAQGNKVGTGTITAVADYPDFRGKHYPLASNAATANWTWGGYKEVTIEAGETDQFKYIVFHALDRDGFCSQPATLPVSLHPVLSSWDDDFTVGANDPIENVDFLIDAGEGIIVNRSDGGALSGGNNQFATDVLTYSTAVNTTIKEFPALHGSADECQAWIRVSNSLLGILNVLVLAADDEGNIGFDVIVDLQGTTSYTLNFRWSLVTWIGKDNIAVADALKGAETPDNAATNSIFDQVTAVYGWNQAAQEWLGFFPDGVNVPGANDLVSLDTGSAYWIAIKGPSAVTWTIATSVDQ